MTTDNITTGPITLAEALAAQAVAEAAYAAAIDAEAAAAADVAEAERAAAELYEAFIAGDHTITPAQMDKANQAANRAALYRDRAAAELARSADQARLAALQVTICEYDAEYERFNDPDLREHVLMRQLTAAIAEAIPLIRKRKGLHNRLWQQARAISPEDRQRLVTAVRSAGSDNGYRIADTSYERFNECQVTVPLADLAAAIEAGVQQAGTR